MVGRCTSMRYDVLRRTSMHFDALRCTSKGWSMHSPLGCYTRYISNKLNCTDYFINSRNCTAYLSKIVKPSRMHLLLLLFKTIAFEAFEIVQCSTYLLFLSLETHTHCCHNFDRSYCHNFESRIDLQIFHLVHLSSPHVIDVDVNLKRRIFFFFLYGTYGTSLFFVIRFMFIDMRHATNQLNLLPD